MSTERSVDQHRATDLISARPGLFARQGAVVATWRRRNGAVFGPYFRLSYRQDGRQCSVYLGRPGPVVDLVRQRLHALQAPLRRQRALSRIERESRSALRSQKTRLAVLLRPYGLRLHGLGVRGWRTSPLRPWLPRRGSLIPSLPRFSMPTLPRVSTSFASVMRCVDNSRRLR